MIMTRIKNPIQLPSLPAMEEAALFPMTLAQRTKAEATAASLKPTVTL